MGTTQTRDSVCCHGAANGPIGEGMRAICRRFNSADVDLGEGLGSVIVITGDVLDVHHANV